MLRTNLESLVEVAVAGVIAHPGPMNHSELSGLGFASSSDGRAVSPVVSSGITLNVKVGDRAFGWARGDHLIPGVAIRNSERGANAALQTLACVGNEARIVSAAFDGKDSKLKGAPGVVVGKNACTDVVSIYFPKRVLEHLAIGDTIQIKAYGQGLALPDYPGISIMNCSPELFKAINATEKERRIRVSVTCIIPAKVVGSGIGAGSSFVQGCDIQSSSPKVLKEYKLENIRLGDLVAIADLDAAHGARWHHGAITVGVVVHGASVVSGHGPGVAFLFTSSEGQVEPVITRKANVADLLGLG